MMIDATVPYRFALATAAVVCLGGMPAARAQDASPWDGELHAASRLIAGTIVNSGEEKSLRAGVEIRLDPGWKTYWRYPGDSGVPPALDFAGSENVKAVSTLWPAPRRFPDGAGGNAIGYEDDVVLPLRVVPSDANKPSLLRLKLNYAVCGKLCVPAQAELRLTLSGKGGTEESTLAAAEARVPRRVALGAGRGLSITAVHRDAGGAHGRVVVDVAAPDGTPVDLFAEGPTREWGLPLPEASVAAPGRSTGTRRFAFDLDGLPPGASADGATIVLTAVSPTDAIEVEAHLD